MSRTSKSSNMISILICLVCLGLVYYIFYRYRIRVRTIIQPVEVTIEHHIYRIPLEDRVDLDVNDRHNVHNLCLKRSAVGVIQNLMTSDQHQFTIETAISDIQRVIEFSIDADIYKLENAEQSLKLIEEIDATYTSGNIKETELLRLIWERIHHSINSNNKDQLISNLIEQLADCKHGSRGVHCCEGRIMRLLQSLEGCDNQNIVNLRPMWAYKEEIANKISKYRQKLMKKAPSKYAIIDQKLELNTSEQKMLINFNKCLIQNLNKRFKIDYISQGLLSTDELDDITKPFYDSLED